MITERNELLTHIKQVLVTIVKDEKVLDMDESATLKNDLGIDSMNSLVFLMKLEQELAGFKVDPETLEASHFETIGTISDYIFSQLNMADA
ncbi:acyl carrier protein [Pseudoalteromonas sp. S16_S37]|uniref:acyl carrier protein n=1 Tax=Pseudoalteromonas sp. S16_S37 TaxID=2720228 RepID=UPI0016813BE2|nr:acyl carrier protein [Pseudoalteromonas sp. S16_S37]MBD1584437.1 acyl carrier protein [Pseudoalteromonas sp. S16_S37]